MTLWKIKYAIQFEGREGWVSAESSILLAGEDGAEAIAELFQEVMEQEHLDDREKPPVSRKVAMFRLRGLTLVDDVDMISVSVLKRYGLEVEDTTPRDIRGNAPLT